MTPRLSFTKKFRVLIPTREEWNKRKAVTGPAIPIFTDGSKMSCGVGAGIISKPLNISKSLKLPDNASVFQAELLAILEACRSVKERRPTSKNISIFIDSQAAIKALDSAVTSSKLVQDCRNALNDLCGHLKVSLIWVPGHSGIKGNEEADELARTGSALDGPVVEGVSIPLSAVKRYIYSYFLREAEQRWKNLPNCRTSRLLWPSYNKQRTSELLNKKRPDIARIIAISSGHWPVGDHAARLGIPFNSHCRSCKDAAERETLVHYLCKCPALASARHRALGLHIIGSLSEVARVRIQDLILFLNSTGWM